MPTVSNASNKQVDVVKMQIKGKPWQLPTGQLPPGTCHTDLSVETKTRGKRTGP